MQQKSTIIFTAWAKGWGEEKRGDGETIGDFLLLLLLKLLQSCVSNESLLRHPLTH